MTQKDPYQIFFPIGILNAILAVGVWFVQDLRWFSTPTVLIHSRLIVGGFLWSFIIGFLMTALPRMTGTASANRYEYLAALSIILAQMGCAWPMDGRPYYGATIALIGFVLVYGGRRALARTKQFPVFFSHIAIAMMLALIGAIFHYRGNAYMGIHLYPVGMVLLLVLGIGTRFFSFLAGLSSQFETAQRGWRHWVFHGLGVTMGLLLILSGTGVRAGYLGLALVSLVYLFGVWQVQRPSNRPSALKHGVRIVAAMIPASFFLAWLQPGMFVTWLHLLFIGCFGLITFSVATRVVLAHGAFPVNLEMKSPALWAMVVLFLLSLVSRVLYGFSSAEPFRKSFLHLAATLWILAVGSWCWSFGGRIFRTNEKASGKTSGNASGVAISSR